MGDGACVYVSQTLLDAVERDKRALKWQLAQATKAAESRAAQLAASEAKVKDLMTIVEMNKSVADKAVQRSYSKQCLLQRLHLERVQLQTRVETLYRNGLDFLQRRASMNRQRETFQQWRSEARVQRRRKAAVRRVTLSDRRRRLRRGFHCWRQMTKVPDPACSQSKAEIYPLPLSSLYTFPVPEKPPIMARPTVRFALSSSSSSVVSDSMSISSLTDSHQTLSFATWKAQWLARKRRHTTAIHFARLMLVKRVLAAWKQVIRRRNWRDAMIATATQRRRYHRFHVWASWAKRRRRTRTLLNKIQRRLGHQRLRQAFMRLRVKCLEKCMTEWGEVLRDARNAIEEERKIYALQQSEAMNELEKQAAHYRLQQKQLVKNEIEALDARRRQAVLVRCIGIWLRRVMLRRIQMRVATQFYRFCNLRRLEARSFTAWKARAREGKRLDLLSQRRQRRQTRELAGGVFWAFRGIVQLLRRQRHTLRRVLLFSLKMAALRCFWKWRVSVNIENEQANAHLQQRELSQRLDMRELAWRGEAQRLRRVAYRYQLQCALCMGDSKREKRTREVFAAWQARVHFSLKCKAVLWRLIKHKARRGLEMAVAKWQENASNWRRLNAALQVKATDQERRRLRHAFQGWRSTVQRQQVVTARGGLQYFTLMMWKSKSKQQHARKVAFERLIQRHLLNRWERPAFNFWRKKSNVARLTETRRHEQKSELLQRTFRRWATRLIHWSQQRRQQYRAIAEKAERRAAQRLLEGVWSAWRGVIIRQGITSTCSTLCFALKRRHENHRLLRLSLVAWASSSFRSKHKRLYLQRMLTRQCARAKGAAWIQWRGIVASHQGVRAGHAKARHAMQIRLKENRLQRLLRFSFSGWQERVIRSKKQKQFLSMWLRRRRVLTLALCLITWRRDFVSRMHFRRLLLRSRMEVKWKGTLRLGLQQWKRHISALVAIQTQINAFNRQSHTQCRALEVMRRIWTSRDLRACFCAWRTHTRKIHSRKAMLERVFRKRASRLQLLVLTKLSVHCEQLRVLERLVLIWIRLRLFVGWKQLRDVAETCATREQVIHRLLAILLRVFVRASWTQWKRQDRLVLKNQVALTQSSLGQSIRSFMDRIGARHFAKALLLRIFGRWRAQARSQHQLRQRVLRILTKQDFVNVRKSFLMWSSYVEGRRKVRLILSKAIHRQTFSIQCESFATWKSFSVKQGYEARLIATQHQLHHHRESLARHVAIAMFLNWQKPTLATVFRGWRAITFNKVRAVDEMATRVAMRRRKMVMFEWRKRVRHQRAASHVLLTLLSRRRVELVKLAWHTWSDWCWRLEAVEISLRRLCSLMRLRLLRAAWTSLRAHYDRVQRHQSMAVVISVQAQLRQQKELFRLRRVAFVMQRQERCCVKEPFVAWKLFVASRRQHHLLMAAVGRRHNRRKARWMLRNWRGVVIQSQAQRNRIDKWVALKRKPRWVRGAWNTWRDFVVRRCHARILLQQLVENQGLHALYLAWRRWRDLVLSEIQTEKAEEVDQWRRATMMQQRQVESLEEKTEQLLLQSVELRRAAQAQRQRCAVSFVTKLARVENAAEKRRVRRRWGHWATLTNQARLMQRVLNRLHMLREGEAFSRWKETTDRSKWAYHQSMMLDRVARILGESSVQVRKKTTWRRWRMFVKQRHAKQKQCRLVEELTRKAGDGTMLRCVFVAWKNVVRGRRRSIDIARKMRRLVDCRHLRLVFRAWVDWRERECSKREGWLVVGRIYKAIERRSLQRAWLRWRNSACEAVVVMANTRAVLLEVESAELELKYATNTMLLRALTAWREVTTQSNQSRDEKSRLLTELQSKWITKSALYEWQRHSLLSKLDSLKKQRPVLCVRTQIKGYRTKSGSLGERGAVVHYGQYKQHRHLHHWRLQLASRVASTRLRRLHGLAWMLSCLRRLIRRALRRSLWRWFARIQPMSNALQAVDYRALPWRRVDVDYASSMLLLTLEELDLARQTHHNELLQRAWRVVDAIARSANRQGVRRAFDKWRWGQRARRTLVARGTRHRGQGMANTERTRARACVAQLVRVRTRRAFDVWKTQYIASAMAQARAEYEALQAALTAAATRRRSIMGVVGI